MPERLFWCDLVRAVACLFVVALHAAAVVLYRYGDISFPDWWLGNAVDALTRPAVPLFFMLSGALTFDDGPGDGRRLWRRLARILWPLLFYSLLALFYAYGVGHQKPGIHSLPVWQQFYHLWFFYSMAGVLLLAAFVRPRGFPPAQAVVLLTLVLLVLGGGLEAFVGGTDLSVMQGLPVYFLYYLWGHYAARLDPRLVMRWRWPCLLLFLAASVWLAVATGWRSQAAGDFDGSLYVYYSVPVIAQAVTLFLFLRGIAPGFRATGVPATAVSALSRLSLGIYGFHPFVLGLLVHAGITGPFQPVALEIVLRFALALAASLALTLLLRRTLDRGGRIT